jgi:predicted Abi (CAAX) family protease
MNNSLPQSKSGPYRLKSLTWLASHINRHDTERDREVLELANRLIAQYGERAITYAKYQSLKAAQRDEKRAMEIWHRIADAADRMWQVEPI